MGRKIARVSCDKNFDAIHIMVTAEVEEIARDLKTNEILNPENKKQKICEYWSFIRRPSAKTLKKPGLIEGSCPNCGAPIEIGQATVCPVCKSYLRSGYYDWVLAKITQACEWEYANPKLVPGYNDIIRVDSDFSIHQIEDRCAVIFWMLRLVERRQTMDPILRFATEKCCQGFRFMMRGVKKYTYLENVSFASATLKVVNVSEQSQRIYVLVVYSGIPVTCTAEGRLPTLHRFSKPKRDVLVFVRKPDQKTNLNNTLTSAHCHNCGGPLTSNYAINCSYCNALLIDGSEWLLEKVLSEQSHEYLEQSSKKQELIQKAVKETKKKKEEIKIKRSGRDVISIAAEVLVADGKVEESEMEMLEKLASMYAMPKDQLKGIVEAAKQGEIHVPEPENIKESKAIIEAAIEMALVDGNLADEERDSIEKVGKKLGYAKPDLKMMFTKAINKQSLAKRKKKI
jgi:tellurite resistance protein